MNSNNNKCRYCQIKSNVVSILSTDELQRLEKGCSQVKYKKGELIFKEGSPAKQITYIRDGFVKLSKKGIGGKECILSISKRGAYLGIQNLNLKRQTNYFSAFAVTDSEICFIDIPIFDQLLKRNGLFASEIISYIFNDEMNYFDRLVNNVQQQLPGRLASALLYFYHEVYDQNPFTLNLTKLELASLIGTSRESVTRLLKEFQNDGLVKADKTQIQILNETKLEVIKRKG